MEPKYIIPLDEIASITDGGIGAVITLIAQGVRNKTPIVQDTTPDGLNGIPREVVCELFQSGKLKLVASGMILNPAQIAFMERHGLKAEDLHFDPEFDKRPSAPPAPEPTIIAPGPKLDMRPEELLKRFLIDGGEDKGGGGGRVH